MGERVESKKNVYFYCCIGGDLLICAGISKILKGLDQNYHTVLVLPAHVRVKGKMERYYHFFDQLEELPYCSFGYNIFKTLPKIVRFLKALNNIRFAPGSVCFMFDVYDLTELLFYRKIRNLKKKIRIRLNILTAFNNGELEKNRKELVIKGTVLKSLYALPLAHQFFYEYKTRGTNFVGLHSTRTRCDLQVCIKQSKYQSVPDQVIRQVNYPPNIFFSGKNEFETQEGLFDKGTQNIILLVDGTIAHQIKDYWEDTGTMIRKLRMNGYELFLKDHPLSTVRLQDVITEEVKIIPGKLHIEELFLGYKDEIKAICGYGSTALLTASWLGIHAVDLSALYHFPELLKERFRIFVSMGENIRTVYSVDQLDNIGQLTDREISLPVSELYQEWENIMMGQTTNLAR